METYHDQKKNFRGRHHLNLRGGTPQNPKFWNS